MKYEHLTIPVALVLVLVGLSCSDGPVIQQDVQGDAADALSQDLVVDRIEPEPEVIVLDSGRDTSAELPGDTFMDTADITDVDTAIQPGEFGSSCLQNKDCEDGFCVEGVDGLVCTRPCTTDCPDDWLCRAILQGGDLISVCVPSGAYICRACTKNAQCANGLCIPIGEDGTYCTRSCSDLSPCPENYNCELVTNTEDQTQSRQCVPNNGTCSCKLVNDKEERTCAVENTFGTCLGFQTCEVATGWSACTANQPSEEVCDGIDNDCNRIADDNPALPEGVCQNSVEDVGSCPGSWVCRGEAGWDCVGPLPALETCNYLDDDCDGDTDEDFKENGALADFHNCGQCGVDCEGLIPFALETACDGTKAVPECIVTKCVLGYVLVDEHTCRPAISSLCVQCDDDADCGAGGVDKCLPLLTGNYCGRDCSATGPYGPDCPLGYSCNDFGSGVFQCVPQSGTCECTMASDGIKRLCEVSNEFGTCQGNEVCDGSIGWVNCSARTPASELCDGIDNDCDGLADNDPAQPDEECEKFWTDPETSTEYRCTASWTCSATQAGKEWVCPAREPSAEVCNNLDDNCDGLIDEDFKLPGTNKYNNIDHCGACNVSCEGLVPRATMMCDATGTQPRCVVDTCDEGYWKASDLSCQPFPESLCMACASDAACQIPGDRCLPADASGSSYCLWDCSEDALRPDLDPVRRTCPEGYYCRETNDLGQPLFKCFPNSGACDCIAGDEGQVRVCVTSNSFGQCYGQESCVPGTGWTACDARVPSAEMCNTQDDDCNGLVDENFPSVGAICAAGIGECQRAGSMVCNLAGDGVECTAVAGAPVAELCDGLDNDCDTMFDEDFSNLGKVCFAGSGECLASGFYECRIDGTDTECNAVAGTPSTDICDEQDNDCDGSVDEDFVNKGRVCAVGVGECFANGVWVCTGDGSGVECDGVPGTPSVESCDGLDNNCDGSVDENWPEKNTVCVVGVGACANTGVFRCSADMSGLECSVTAGSPTDELCDGIDNDCDGEIDEDWTNKGRACQEGVGECLGTGVWVCTGDLSGVECDAVQGMPLDEACDGLDNDCDGSIDEDFTNLGRACSAGVGECLAAGVYQCTVDMTGTECDAVAGTPSTEACDGLDNDCDGNIDEDFTNLGRACSAGIGECLAAGVYQCTVDMTGTECNAVPGTPVDELCDGLDNDCDGSADETWTNKGTACQEGVGACLANGVWACTGDLSGVECTANPGTPTLELCDGIDNDCDGSADEDWTNKGRACQEGVGECLGTGVWVCTGDLSGVECDAVQGMPLDEACDGLDNDCDGNIDEDFTNLGRACSAGVGECLAAGVYQCTIDMTGTECNAVPGTPVDELCDGLDNNCNGSADETWTNKGTACQEGVGACLANGVWACTGDLSGVECTANPGTPTVELCDGIDNDCDGSADETWTNKGTACQEGVGACLANGVWACTGDLSGVECTANPGTPTLELCDGIDNDCDGSADETWTNKGRACQEGVGACFDSGVWVCRTDKTDVECDAEPGTPTVELCDGLDNDCDGSLDEDFTNLGRACSAGIGECLAAGVYQCTVDMTGTECNAVPGTPVDELCDGLDNNCNGSADETWTNKGTACQEGVGACLANGVWACTGDLSGVECTANPGTPTLELCDGIDNDCDGSVDETWTNKGTACQEGVGACLANGVWACTGDLSGVECTANPGTPTPERCDGIDNDCDGSADETWTNLGRSCQEGQGECLDIGVWVCTADHLGVECDAVAGTPSTEVCDDLDNDCDGAIDEDWTNKGRACQAGLGECLANGVYVCAGDQQDIECNAVQGMPLAEECDGLDNNCDGSIDETWPEKGTACQEGVGECQANGVFVCTGDFSDVECNAVQGMPLTEECDGLDNDCDGSADESFPAKGSVCFDGIGACQRSGTMECSIDGTTLDCSATPGSPTTEQCDGIDNDCDASTDENFPAKGTVCTVGLGQCVATGTWQCNPAKTGVECPATPGTPTTEVCDYLDNDCDGSTDQTFKVGGQYATDTACGNCFTDCTDIYDLPNAYGECDATGAPVCEMQCETNYYDLNEVPDDGCEFYLDPTAVYVSHNDPDATDDSSCGLAPSSLGIAQHPCLTIQHGITRAGVLGRANVLVSNGLYGEAITLAAGINVKGGYRADTWERDVEATMTTIRGSSGTTHKTAVTASGITTPTLFEGFIVYGPTNFTASGNSYALYLSNCTSALTVSNNLIYGGYGAAGATGSNGSEGADGVDGVAGENTIETNTSSKSTCDGYSYTPGNLGTAGDGGSRTCGVDDNVSGGPGAGAECPSNNSLQPSGTAGQPGVSGGSGGSGGAGGRDRTSDSCGTFASGGYTATGQPGGDGGNGTDGTGGAGCPVGNNGGQVVSGHWSGFAGSNGNSGTAGGGGGGGGAGGGADVTSGCSGTDDCLGGSGGGGGSGACGGTAATGGSAGGGAFTIFITFSSPSASYPVLTNNQIVRGQGGRGGDGGNGGAGGLGGDGALGGEVAGHWAYAMGPGGRGGQGGDGGHGGGGGGGCGGVSYGIFVYNGTGAQPSYAILNVMEAGGTGGAGGSGGSSLGNSGTAAVTGASADVVFF